MSTITKERVAQIIHAAGLEPCDYEEVFDSIKTGEIIAMARIALASLEAEPVGWRWSYGGKTNWKLQESTPGAGNSQNLNRVIQPLYTATPAPAVDSEPVAWWTGPEPTPTGEIESIHDHETGSHSIPLYPSRAAMLQGKE